MNLLRRIFVCSWRGHRWLFARGFCAVCKASLLEELR